MLPDRVPPGNRCCETARGAEHSDEEDAGTNMGEIGLRYLNIPIIAIRYAAEHAVQGTG